MTILPWPEWMPDQADFTSPGTPVIQNCVPLTAKSYGPMLSAVPYSVNTLSEPCQGSYSIRAPDGSVHIYAGDRQKLYHLPPTSRIFADASRTTGGAYATPPVLIGGGHWSMTSFGARIVAVNGVDRPQSLMLGGANFTELSAQAPVAKYCAVVKDFMFFGNTIDAVDGPRPYRVWWSAINSPAYWPTPGSVEAQQTQSDFQDLQQTDLGNVTGLVPGFAPGSDVVIFTERGIYTASYVGPPLIFNFRTALGSSGTTAQRSIVVDHARDPGSGAIRPVCYYLSSEGFAAFDGTASYPIGAQKFDRAFFTDLDDSYVTYVQGVRDPRSHSVIWAYPSVGSGGLFNRLLVYNWELSRATIIRLEPSSAYVEWLTNAMYGGIYHLDNIDSFGNLDTIAPSFDDPFWTGNMASRLSFFDRDHRLGIGGGPPLPAILETGEVQPAEGRRAWVRMSRPLNDGGVATVAVGHRERLTDPVTWETPVNVNQLGECPQRCTGRYLRFRMTLAPGQGWHHAQGLDFDLMPEARRR
jgi:hypothetical protein